MIIRNNHYHCACKGHGHCKPSLDTTAELIQCYLVATCCTNLKCRVNFVFIECLNFTFALQGTAKNKPLHPFFYGATLNMQQPIRKSALISPTSSCTGGAKCQQHDGEPPGTRQQRCGTSAQAPHRLDSFIRYKST